MADLRPSDIPMPDLGPLGRDAQIALALHGIADVREQLLAAQRTLAGSIAVLSELVDGPVPPLDPS